MTVFLTPDLEPFYAGTYFPPSDGHGRPGFPRLLRSISQAWEGDRANVVSSAATVTERMREASTSVLGATAVAPTPDLPGRPSPPTARPSIRGTADSAGHRSFPSPANLEFLLTHDQRVGDDGLAPGAREMVFTTLREMWAGGIYDPSRRRILALQRRRRLAGPSLRDDALRQRPAGEALSARLPGQR